MERTITRDRYLDIYVPTMLQNRFKRDEKYRVVFDSIQLVEKSDELKGTGLEDERSGFRINSDKDQKQSTASWSRNQESPMEPHLLKAQSSKDGKAISFALNRAWIEKQMKLTFEPGRRYQVSGLLGGICRFSSFLRETGYSETYHVYVPTEHIEKFKRGVKYDVRIEEIKEVSRAIGRPSGNVDSYWEWKTVAAWADTEGQYQSGRNGFKAVISQDEREPLDGIRDFLLGEDIPSVVYDLGNGHYQLRTLGGMESLAKFVLHTEPHIRTQNKRNQIAKFKEQIGNRIRHENVHRRNARRILGL